MLLKNQLTLYKIINLILLNICAPIILAFAISPSLIDHFFTADQTTKKIITQMLCYALVFCDDDEKCRICPNYCCLGDSCSCYVICLSVG